MDAVQAISLSLNDLEKGCPGITPRIGKFLSEASKVCFINQKHNSGIKLNLDGISSGDYEVVWTGKITDQMLRSWSDEIEMTNFGACGVAVLLVLKMTKYTILQRARIGTGVDYWLSEKKSTIPFQHSARLEVSGILNGNNSAFNSRVKTKLNQTQPTDNTGFPVYVVVVEFSAPKAKMVTK